MAEESKLADKYKDVTTKQVKSETATKKTNPEDDTKFNKEEVEKAKEIRQVYADIQYTFGQIGIARVRLEQQLDGLEDVEGQLKDKFMKTQSEEQDYIAAIQKKYGDGTLDPETGIFTQNKPVAPK